jgi:hypothetical protein
VPDFDDKNDDTLVEIVCFSLDFLVLVEIAKKSVKIGTFSGFIGCFICPI